MFAAGFALGTIRTIIVAPQLGETNAVLIELPLMLTVSWFVVSWAAHRWHVRSVDSALTMGVVAFALLQSAELALAVMLFGERWQDWAGNLVRLPGVLGFAAQIAFALMPLFRVVSRRDH